jgi:hypothetical protein
MSGASFSARETVVMPSPVMKAMVFSVGLPPSVGGVAAGLFFVLPSMPRSLEKSSLRDVCGAAPFASAALAPLIYDLPPVARLAVIGAAPKNL